MRRLHTLQILEPSLLYGEDDEVQLSLQAIKLPEAHSAESYPRHA